MDPITTILTTVCACGFLHLINFFPSTNQLQGLERKNQLGEENMLVTATANKML
jgi:hypothetical protein